MQITLQEHGTLYETKCNRSTENIINGVISRGSGTGRIRKQQSSGASAHPRSITCATAVRTHKRVNGKCHYLVRRLDYTHLVYVTLANLFIIIFMNLDNLVRIFLFVLASKC